MGGITGCHIASTVTSRIPIMHSISATAYSGRRTSDTVSRSPRRSGALQRARSVGDGAALTAVAWSFVCVASAGSLSLVFKSFQEAKASIDSIDGQRAEQARQREAKEAERRRMMGAFRPDWRRLPPPRL